VRIKIVRKSSDEWPKSSDSIICLGQKESSDIHRGRRNNHPATVGDSMIHKKKLIEVALPLAAVLNTPWAIAVSVFVVRAFVRLREILTTHNALAHKLAELESKIEIHDEAIRSLVVAIRQLMASPEKPPKKIGFQLREKRAAYGRR
jgi:hypothetical protein